MSKYTGYLAPHVGTIREQAAAGIDPRETAEWLYWCAGLRTGSAAYRQWGPEDEVRAILAMVRYVLRGGNNPPSPEHRQFDERRYQIQFNDWETWTPERQHKEFANELRYTWMPSREKRSK